MGFFKTWLKYFEILATIENLYITFIWYIIIHVEVLINNKVF